MGDSVPDPTPSLIEANSRTSEQSKELDKNQDETELAESHVDAR
jgi:hypothetical protein